VLDDLDLAIACGDHWTVNKLAPGVENLANGISYDAYNWAMRDFTSLLRGWARQCARRGECLTLTGCHTCKQMTYVRRKVASYPSQYGNASMRVGCMIAMRMCRSSSP